MSRTAAARSGIRRALRPIAVGLLCVAATAGILGCESVPAAAPSLNAPGSQSATNPEPNRASTPRAAIEADGVVTEADGILPDRVAASADDYPGVANLDPDLLKALRDAAADAADDGIALLVTSGWRSPEYQDQLLRAAISTYGSPEKAARWVATAATSAHVSGDAVDVGPSSAAAWLSTHGAGYGLCQIYRNEPWHYELRAEAIDHRCPRMYADPTQDPRMQ